MVKRESQLLSQTRRELALDNAYEFLLEKGGKLFFTRLDPLSHPVPEP